MTATTTPRALPIIFSAPMVRAILEGRKSQTRRVLKPQWPVKDSEPKEHSCLPRIWIVYTHDGRLRNGEGSRRCPFGTVGDHLWVREQWATHPNVRDPRHSDRIYYRADPASADLGLRWRPSIHLPRWASRITLEVTAIRLQRFSDISEADARCEGLVCEPDHLGDRWGAEPGQMTNRTAIGAYGRLWNSLNKQRGYPWQSEPWVWAVTFRRLP